jgi:hypothetical protein
VLGILDRMAFMTIRAINKEIRATTDPHKFQNITKLWRRTNPYPVATACSTSVRQPAFVHDKRNYFCVGTGEICGKEIHFYKKTSSFDDGSHGTGGGGSDPESCTLDDSAEGGTGNDVENLGPVAIPGYDGVEALTQLESIPASSDGSRGMGGPPPARRSHIRP